MSFLSSGAEAKDHLATLTAVATGFISLIFSINIIVHYVSDPMAIWLDRIQIGGGILILAVFLPIFVFLKFRVRRDGPASDGGFFDAVFRKAGYAGFAITLGMMVMLSTLNNKILANISAEMAVDLIITFALGVFSIAFFIISHFGLVDDQLR